MRRASILSGAAFRSALLFLIVFVFVLGVAGYAILKATQASMADQTRTTITEDVQLLRDANDTGGEKELVRFIQDSVATRSDKQYAFGVFHTGKRLAGNITVEPKFRGWGLLDHEVGQADGVRFVGFVEALGDNIVVVGRSETFMAAISGTIRDALILAGCVICASVLVIGYLISRGVSSKLDVIDTTLGQVSHGNSEIRLPIGPSNDQIDHVSRQINAHLDRLSEFMSGMRNTVVAIAHDLKSPLNRAYILLQQAADEREPEAASVKLERAQEEMDTLRGVLDTILRITRIETSDDNSNFAAFSPTALLRDLAQTFEPVVEGNGQTLRCPDLTGEGVPIFGDRRMVEQMLVNLIENASRHAGKGTVIEMGVAASQGGAVVTIADTGPGIPASLREEVFRPFRRLNDERGAPGAGLGLALVKAVAARHHARVELGDNNPGLKVTLSFPPMRAPFV